MDDFPVQETKSSSKSEQIICLPYDLEDIYAMFCSRYKDISYNEFLKMGYDEFSMKLNSIPEREPYYTILKARAINTGKIKDKEEKKYWNNLKKIHKIPDIYKTVEEIQFELSKKINKGGITNVR